MSDVLLIRHGLCDTVGRSIAGRFPGTPLNPTGVHQARGLAERLKALPIEAVYSSPQDRTRETAGPLAELLGLPVRISPGLDELDFGAWTGRTLDALRDDPEWRRFNTERGSTRIPGGETMGEVVARATAELSRIASEHPEALVAAVTHGDVIRALLAAYAGMPLDCMLRLEVAPASVSAVRLGSEPLVLAVNWLTDGIGGIGPWDLPAR